MAVKRLDAPLSPALEQLLADHRREVERLREYYNGADPAEVLARFVRSTFSYDALMQVRDSLGVDGALIDDWEDDCIDLDDDR